MQIKFTVEEYFRELKLMQRQYGQEEELYPLINILLRGHINSTQDVSIRSVAGARYAKIVSGRKLLSGGGKVFPDIAILSTSACMNECKVLAEECIRNSREYIYGCVEAKKVGAQLLEFKEFNEDDKSEAIYSVLYERKIQKRLNENGKYNCYTLNLNEQDVPQKFLEKFCKSEKWLQLKDCEEENWNWVVEKNYKRMPTSENDVNYRILEQFKNISFNDSIKLERQDVSEILNEIIWYEKVLYTNGEIWKYLELESIKLKDNKQWDCEEFRKKYFNKEETLEQIETITIKCFTICKLDLGKNASDIDNQKEWNRLEKNLSRINWSGKTEFKNFI